MGGVDDLSGLMARFARDGDAAAMDLLVARTRPALLAVARRIGAPQDADDTVQTAYLSLVRRVPEAPDHPFAWLVATVVRIAYRRKALARREDRLATALARPADDDPQRGAVREEEARVVRREVARLPAKYRDVVVLHHIEGLGVEDVARLLDVPAGTVKTRLRRARVLLRGRLAPFVSYLLLAPPWLAQDALAAARDGLVATLGGAMKAKTAALVAMIAVAAGAAGLGAGTLLRRDAAPVRAAAPRDGAEVLGLRAELDVERERARLLEERLAVEVGPAAPAKERGAGGSEQQPETPGAGSRESAAGEAKPFPAKAVAAAEELRVGENALRIAAATCNAAAGFHGKQPKLGEVQAEYDRTLAELRAYGEEGYLAVIALLKAENGIHFDRVLHDAYVPGYERHLLAAAADATFPEWSRWSLLRGLGAADTPEVRTFLNDFVAKTEKAGLFFCAAGALGELRDPTSARVVEERLFRDGYGGVEGHLLAALGGMGGPEAVRILETYLDDRRAKQLATAVMFLSKLDTARAAAAARRLLADPRAETLPAHEREILKQAAGVR
jgi:RNA polymerase sigma-70 factor (ECF subfamily)